MPHAVATTVLRGIAVAEDVPEQLVIVHIQLNVRLKQLPRVPSFCEAVIQQQRAIEDEAEAAKKSQNLADRLAI